VLARMCAPAPALDAMSREVFARWPGEIESEDPWASLREFRWAHRDNSVGQGCAVARHGVAVVRGARMHVSAGWKSRLCFAGFHGTGERIGRALAKKLGLSAVTLPWGSAFVGWACALVRRLPGQ